MGRLSPLRVVIINPPPWKVVEPWYDEPNFPRQSVGYLAGYLRQFEDFTVKVIDCKLERIGFTEAVKRVLDFEADVVALTAFTNEIKPAAHLAGLVKKGRPEAVTVIGGVHVTALPAATLKEFPSFDIGCHGEGEVTFHELCDAIHKKTSIKTIPGLVYRQGDTTVQTPERLRSLDLDAMPFPAYDLFPKFTEFFLMSQRGCPFRCSFCMNPNGRVPRQRSIKNVMDEINLLLDNYPTERFFFGDELFSVDMNRTHVLLDEMIKAGVPKKTKFWIETHVNFVDYEMFRHLKEAGCYEAGMGIETGDEDKLAKMGKGTNLKMIKDAFDAAKKARVSVQSLFIIGHPNDDVNSIKRTIDFATRLNPNTPVFGVMVPYPGTDVARLAAKKEGGYRLATTDWDEFNKQVGGALEFAGLTREQIEWLQFSGYLKVFIKNFRIIDLIKFGWRYRVAGFEVLMRIVKRLVGRKAPETSATVQNAPIDAIYLEEMHAASVKWEKSQLANLQYIKHNGNSFLTRVLSKKQVKNHHLSEMPKAPLLTSLTQVPGSV